MKVTITRCTAAGEIEVVTADGVQVWMPGEVNKQGTLWKGTWPRERKPERPALRLIRGGKA